MNRILRTSGQAIKTACTWSRIRTLLAVSLLLAGGFYIAMPRVQAAVERHQGAQQNPATIRSITQQRLAQPGFNLLQATSIAVPRLNMKLDIQPGYYNTTARTWTLDRTHAFLMETTANQIATATPVIYGHDIPSVFMHLSGMASQEVVVISMQDGRQLYFKYVGDTVVNPTDTNWLAQHKSNMVLLMTCTGPTFAQRRVMQLEYVGATAPAGQPTESRS